MRTLNRPMFRYGGPIKEGVMSGIREPKKDGGPMNEPQAINTVGSPLAPQGSDGRQQYALPLLAPIAMAAARVLPAAYRGYKASRYLNPNAATTGQKVMNFFKPRKSLSAPMAKTGEGLGFKIGSFARTNPVSTFGIASAVPQAGYGSYKLAKAGIKGAPDLAKNYIDMVLPGEQFREPPPNITGKNNIQDTNRDDRKKIISTDGSNKGGSGSEKSAEELRKDRVQRYRDIMDIKGMNKNAAYNSLIAASQLINQEGDFKGSIKDGSLISKIIGATGKAFDKPAQTKDAIDTLILKGEIEKDIKASDPSNAQLNALRVMQGKKLQRELNPSFDTLKAGFAKDNKGQSGIDLAAGAYSQNNGETYRGPLISKADFKDILSNLKKDPATQDADEVSIIKTWTQGQLDSSRKNIPDGNYTVGDKIVTIQDKIVVDVN